MWGLFRLQVRARLAQETAAQFTSHRATPQLLRKTAAAQKAGGTPPSPPSYLILHRRWFTVSTARMAPVRDPNTQSNYDAWRTRHTTADFTVDFAAKCLRGSVVIELESQTDRASTEIILDSSFVDVADITLNSAPSKWEVKDRTGPSGSPVHVAVPEGAGKGEVVKLGIQLATTDKCTALQWLSPAQTSNKKAPFMFSQCQAIHARSIFPCQDTPDVKSTYEFAIRSPHVVVASGVPVPEATEAAGEDKIYKFSQKVPIPSYLFALASGDIASAPIGRCSSVCTGPNELKASQWELQDDMDKFLDAAEKIVFPYRWGEYNVLVLPPSFPYGGMENPIFTFATPTIISGDRQNIDVIAHELAHSWSGNLVTNGSWEHFWLNEGWTVYLERRILASIHNNDAYFDFSAIIGWKHLEMSVEEFGADHEYTKLCINHKGIDPDDAFSSVPYEKGFHFIYSLDRLVGRENFDKFIPHYFGKWANKSLDSYEFKQTFLDFFSTPEYASLQGKLAEIDWEGRFYTPGLPPKPEFNTSLVDVCFQLAGKWKQKEFSPSPSDTSSWTGNQVLVFLNLVQNFEEPLTVEQSQSMGKVYGLADSKNVELKAAYYQIAMRAKDTSAYPGIVELLGDVGRMKFVRTLFRSLVKVDRDLAVKTFEKNRDFYHPICRALVEKDLGLAEAEST